MRALALLVALLAAGCVTGSPPDVVGTEQVGAGFVDPIVMDHDHTDPTIHAYAWNLEQVAHHPLAGAKGRSAFGHALDVRGDWLFVATWGETVDT